MVIVPGEYSPERCPKDNPGGIANIGCRFTLTRGILLIYVSMNTTSGNNWV
jgi:hypothetical protein